ncbi:hypothetical protein [Vibrio mangrovi]|uniref:Uncharacterized protein n=1 Tax=Vibrio mangrovi TaxID=474394 RepID=A0A1Y6INJ8_9VIBR|nr:hypothetical protein [Vibrio mangrovi]MDW6003970.1 hypothetical protein [Vibrio mangrovi]SMR99234.1 hypothetical protein VIM7927_00459 [Vibrio mangrovi]
MTNPHHQSENQNLTDQAESTIHDLHLHHTAREYLITLQGACTEANTNYCELWHVLIFLHNLITVSEEEFLRED